MKIFDFDKHKSHIIENLEHCIVKKEDDWNLIAITCDSVNKSDTGAKLAARFIRRKLSRSQPRNVQLRVLTLIKAMTDNCGAKFHVEIASKKFLDELETLVNSPETDAFVKHVLLQLLGTLANTFQNEPSLYQICGLYAKFTGNQGSQVHSQTRYYDGQDRNYDVSLEATIAEDIEVAKNNVQLFTQTLSFTDPESEDITKNELIQEFYKKCKTLHDKLMKYLSEVQDEKWIETLLSVNQELLNAFRMYDDMIERGLLLMAKLKSTKITNRRDEENLFNEEFESAAGVGGSRETLYDDPFGDNNGYSEHKIQSGPSSKALGKMPASIYNDDSIFEEESQDQNNKDQKYSNISTPPIQPYKV